MRGPFQFGSARFVSLFAVLPLGLLFFAPARARAEVIWSGDDQTGNLSQWSNTQEAASNRLQVVTSEAPSGDKYSMEATVEPGDLVSNGARAEVDYTGDSPQEGDVRYYHWQTYFPSDYQTMNVWQIFTQWHQYVSGGSPPLAIMVWNDQIKLGNENNDYFWTGPLQLGQWHDFVVHVVWSVNSNPGGVEMWYDGQHVLPFTYVATLFPNDTIYVKQGLYRSSQITWAQTVYHAGMTIATELSDVMPSTPDAGTVADAGSGKEGGGTTDAGGSGVKDAGEGGGEVTDAGTGLPSDGGTELGGSTGPTGSDGNTDTGTSGQGSTTGTTGSETGSTTKKSLGCASTDGLGFGLVLVATALVIGRRRRRSVEG